MEWNQEQLKRYTILNKDDKFKCVLLEDITMYVNLHLSMCKRGV